jgi:hypothetical protein
MLCCPKMGKIPCRGSGGDRSTAQQKGSATPLSLPDPRVLDALRDGDEVSHEQSYSRSTAVDPIRMPPKPYLMASD